jgi:hypothetical protein
MMEAKDEFLLGLVEWDIRARNEARARYEGLEEVARSLDDLLGVIAKQFPTMKIFVCPHCGRATLFPKEV